jgi:mRNA interferase MazF
LARFVKGDVVVPFPFSDLTQAKRRPSSVVAVLSGDDLILCQITSRAVTDEYAVVIESDDFSSGGLRQSSNVRPNRLFTADKQIILYKAGQLKLEKMNEVITRIVEILQQCVVIRLLTQDDELQFNKSVEIFRKHDVFIPDTVILENWRATPSTDYR